eukprot:SAG31_NODE_620_length_13503_cov_11.724112_7_plen_94_part_00
MCALCGVRAWFVARFVARAGGIADGEQAAAHASQTTVAPAIATAPAAPRHSAMRTTLVGTHFVIACVEVLLYQDWCNDQRELDVPSLSVGHVC